jgi:hypothetical protein
MEYVKAARKAVGKYAVTVGKEVGILEDGTSGKCECLKMVTLDSLSLVKMDL